MKMWGPSADATMLDDRYLALSHHTDAASFVVLDVDTGRYFLMDSAGGDETSPFGESVGDLLDHLWSNRISP